MATYSRCRVVVNSLRIFWVFIIVWYEYGIFSTSVHFCNWPDSPLAQQEESQTNHTRPAHVLLIADPQIINRNSYPSRSVLSAYLTRLIVDLNLRKNWHVAIEKKPDAVVFLGDMMDNGRDAMSDTEYEQYYARFKDIFKIGPGVPQYYIPGNHDIGLGKIIHFASNAHSRYVARFGEPNRQITVANHTLILLDAPGYADEDAQRNGQKKTLKQWIPRYGGALEFVTKFATEQQTDPVVLFSHIPLYRSDGNSCGPLRERGMIRPGAGPGYQNILEKQSSLRLLEALNPVVIFSGDDHDYCEYVHRSSPPKPPQAIREVTVKTLSMVMNVRRPGFQLLSLLPPEMRTEGFPSFADRPCVLPDQLGIYLNIYIPFFALSLLGIFFYNAFGVRKNFHSKTSSSPTLLFAANIEEPEQDEVELNPHYTSLPPSHSSSSQMSSGGHQNHLTSRVSKASAWFELGGSRRQLTSDHPSDFSCLEQICETICQNGSPRKGSRRRTMLSATVRDVRDVAVFPLSAFVLINWWVVTR